MTQNVTTKQRRKRTRGWDSSHATVSVIVSCHIFCHATSFGTPWSILRCVMPRPLPCNDLCHGVLCHVLLSYLRPLHRNSLSRYVLRHAASPTYAAFPSSLLPPPSALLSSLPAREISVYLRSHYRPPLQIFHAAQLLCRALSLSVPLKGLLGR